MPELRHEICRECGCEIHVAPYSPWEGTEKPTGCAASGWDSEACSEYFVGWICLECAFNAAMRDKDEPGIRGMLSGPGPDWEFSYTRGWKMKDVLRSAIRDAVSEVGDPLMCHIHSRVTKAWPGTFTLEQIREEVLAMVNREELRMKEDCVDHDWSYRKGRNW